MDSNNKIPNKAVCVSFRCSAEVYSLLTRVADLMGWTVSKLVSVIVSGWCKDNLPDLVEFEKRGL